MSDTCPECSRPLRGGICAYRHCAAYGHAFDDEDDVTADRFNAWCRRHPETAGLDAWTRFQAEEQTA